MTTDDCWSSLYPEGDVVVAGKVAIRVVEVTNQLRVDMEARRWCLLPYPGHPRGCPNYGKRRTCPPIAPEVGDFFNLSGRMWFILMPFDLEAQAAKMRERHPGWSERQARNCLYWQGTVNKALRMYTTIFASHKPGVRTTYCPEAMGVHVFDTAEAVGVPLERVPTRLVRKVAMVGDPHV